MNHVSKKWILIPIVTIITCLLLFSLNSLFLPLFPSQEAPVTRGIEMGPVMPGFIIIQEIRMKKDNLNGIALLLGRTGNHPDGETLILLLDQKFDVRATLRFPSSNVKDLDYYTFRFPSRVRIGSGQTCYIAIYTPDNASDQLLIGRNASPESGKTRVIPITGHDLPESLNNYGSAMTFPGSICMKTYESERFYVAPVSWFIALLSVLVIFVILFYKTIIGWLSKINLQPHYMFLAFSLIFGHLFLLINPPLLTPDEHFHLYRSYQVATGNFFKFSESVPVSLTKIDSAFRRLYFNRYEKTGMKEIFDHRNSTIDQSGQVNVFSPEYLIPFVPQAIGIFTGSLFNASPLIMIYLGRLFNLWIAVMIIFYAIRNMPFQKWLMFLLGTMPMTLYLLASLSYDALTIALSFLLISKLLQFAYEPGATLKRKEISLLIGILMLLAMCKPPYFLLGILFLIIPVQRAGSLKRYLVYAAVLLLATVAATQVWPLVKRFKPLQQLQSEPFLQPSGESSRAYYRESGHTERMKTTMTGAEPGDDGLMIAKMAFHRKLAFTSDPTSYKVERNAESKPAAIFDNLPLYADLPADNEMDANADPVTAPLREQERSATPSNRVDTTRHEAGSPDTNAGHEQKPAADPNGPPANVSPQDQIDLILTNPGRYLGTLMNTFELAGKSYLISFIGKFGWLFVPLPVWLIITFYAMLFAVSLLNSNETIRIPWKSKLVFLLLLLVVCLLVETAMYLAWNAVGNTFIDGVQGRYFIPVAPLFFLLFYNNILKRKLVIMTSPKVTRNKKGPGNVITAKIKHKRPINHHQPATPVGQIKKSIAADVVPLNGVNHFFSLVVVLFTLVSLVTSVYVILERFYVILN